MNVSSRAVLLPENHGISKKLAVAAILATLTGVFWPMLAGTVAPLWATASGFYSHGLIVAAMVVHLLWQHRHPAFKSPEGASYFYALAAVGASAVWFVGWAADLLAVMLAAMVAVMVLAGSAVLGRRALWWFGAPVALLWFAVPMWAPIQPPLQDLATVVVDALVGLAGVPVFMEGNLVHIPNGVFEIQRGCSGLGFLLVSASLCGYLILLHQPGWKRGLILVGLALLMGLAANWIRIVIIVLFAHDSGMDHPLVAEHEFLGWVVYAVMVFPALWFGLRWLEQRAGSRGAAAHAGRAEKSGRVSALFVAAVVVGSAALPAAAMVLERLPQFHDFEPYVLPPAPDQYIKQPLADSQWQPDFPQADYIDGASYRHIDGGEVFAFAASYAQQQEGREVVSIVNDLGGEGWFLKDDETRKQVLAGKAMRLSEQRFQNHREQSLCVWYWYRIGGHYAGSPLAAKIEQVKQKLIGRADASIVALAAEADAPSCKSVQEELAEFLPVLLQTANPPRLSSQ